MAPVISDKRIATYAYAAGFVGSDLVIAVAVALAESAGNPYAVNTNVNGSVDHGLWQINDINRDALAIGDWRDPAVNARMARIVWKRQGWHAWVTYNHNSHDKFMDRARAAAAHHDEPGYTLERFLRVTTPYEQGSDVAAVQRLTGAIPVDGIYGPITEGYVKKWQKAHGLTPDGIFGPLSCKAAGWNWKVNPHT